MVMTQVPAQEFARHLRRNQTPAERKLWGALRKRTFYGHRFRRQVSIGPYTVDLLCNEKALIIEVDGFGHSDKSDIARDSRRTAFLNRLGYTVHRIPNHEIYENMDGVLYGLFLVLEKLPYEFRRKHPLSPSDSSPSKLEGA
jgi:very-short-patch-repair endonuclease